MNIAQSNFDKEYTSLPIAISIEEEEGIKESFFENHKVKYSKLRKSRSQQNSVLKQIMSNKGKSKKKETKENKFEQVKTFKNQNQQNNFEKMYEN